MHASPVQLAAALFAPALFTRQDLRDHGFSRRRIEEELRSGRLVRVRRDRYARAEEHDAIATAARMGGRVTCLTLLRMLDIFVLSADAVVHVQVPRSSSRFERPVGADFRLHWDRTATRELLHVATLEEAVRHAMRCQEPRAALATLDSLAHHALLTEDQLRRIFADLPRRFRALLRLVDSTAESGPETFVRLMLRALGLSFETQVWIGGVGRVDFVVEGWLIIECDSKEFHEGWDKQKEDRRRDLAAACLGYVTIRPLASEILYDSMAVQQSILRVVDALGPRFARPGRP